jgi:hypothetical protein
VYIDFYFYSLQGIQRKNQACINTNEGNPEGFKGSIVYKQQKRKYKYRMILITDSWILSMVTDRTD